MNILFTGASSFTGYWFVKELAEAGHHVTAVFQGSLESYSGIRRLRVQQLTSYCQPVFECKFGSDKFLQVIERAAHWDLFCHHAADVTDYKSPNFNVALALENNTRNLATVLEKLKSRGCTRMILTGSVFEQGEGIGSDGLRAFSPYGLSKGFTWEIFKYYAHVMGFSLGKFVIPNPFGPYEEPRFTSYLIQNWLQKKRAAVNTPAYVRDNIHISLLAKAYCHFCNRQSMHEFEAFAPSGYVESQGEFTKRFSIAMRERFQLSCEYDLAEQKHFPEPHTRTNKHDLATLNIRWQEEYAWDELAQYYRKIYG